MAANNLGSAWSSMKTIADPRSPNNSSQVTLDGLSSVIEPHIALTFYLLAFTIALILWILAMKFRN